MAKAKSNKGKKVFMTVAIIGGSVITHMGLKQLDKVTKLDPVLKEDGKYKNQYLRTMIEGGAGLALGTASVFIPNEIASAGVAGMAGAAINKGIDDLQSSMALTKPVAGVGAKNKLFDLYEDKVRVNGEGVEIANQDKRTDSVVA